MNKVILMGHIGKIADMVTTTKAKILNFTLATKDVNDTDWHKCVAFNGTAEVIVKHCKVGDKVLIEGKLKYRDYEADGVKRKVAEINVSNVEFAFGKHTEETQAQASAPAPAQTYSTVSNSDNGDLPF